VTRRHARELERGAVDLNSTCPCLHTLNFKFSIQTPKTVDWVFVDESMLSTIDTSRAGIGFELRKNIDSKMGKISTLKNSNQLV
jgi:hypothetical protein